MLDNTHCDLQIGEAVRIKGGFMTEISLVYAGMPSEGVYSLVVTTTAGHMGMGYNLYFPVDQRQFTIAGVPITVRGASRSAIQVTLG